MSEKSMSLGADISMFCGLRNRIHSAFNIPGKYRNLNIQDFRHAYWEQTGEVLRWSVAKEQLVARIAHIVRVLQTFHTKRYTAVEVSRDGEEFLAIFENANRLHKDKLVQ